MIFTGETDTQKLKKETWLLIKQISLKKKTVLHLPVIDVFIICLRSQD